jgi:hypothetical protein
MTNDEVLKTIYELDEIYFPKVMSKYEIAKMHKDLGPFSYRYVIDSKYDIIKFSCNRSFHGPVMIVIEWDTDYLYYKIFSNIKLKKELKKSDIMEIIKFIEEKDFFNSNTEDEEKYIQIDGLSWELEIKYKNKYNNIFTTFINKGIVHDIVIFIMQICELKIEEIIND